MVGTLGSSTVTLEDLKASGDAPHWLSSEGFETLRQGYLLPGETPRMMYRRVSNSVAKYLKKPQLADKFYQYIDCNWLCLASPVAGNSGTTRGLPISCYGVAVEDSLYGIYMSMVETAMLIKHGGGIGCVDQDTEYLTEDGWRKISDYNGERICIVESDSHSAAFEQPLQYIQGPASRLYKLKEKRYSKSIVVSEDHRNYGHTTGGGTSTTIKTTSELLRSGVASLRFISNVKIIDRPGLKFTDLEIRFLVALAADGYDMKIADDCIRFAFRKQRKIERLRTLLMDLNIDHTEDIEASTGNTVFFVRNYGLRKLSLNFENFGDATQEQLGIIVDELGYWDGSFELRPNHHVGFYTSKIDEADFVQYAMLNTFDTRPSYGYTNKRGKGEEYRIRQTSFQTSGFSEYEDFDPVDGKQYCFTTSTGLWLARREGFVFITGNSYWGNLRQRGSSIEGNGISDGIIPWLKLAEITLQSTSQGGVRRGSGAQYLDISSNEIDEFIDLRRNTGDISRRCVSTNFHHAVCIDDDFMYRVKIGDKRAQELWIKILTCRAETGEPYLMFKDTANKNAPACYKANNLKISSSQLCNEIFLFSDPDHTFVCCLSSLNLARYDEWKDSDLVETAIWFLDGVMEEFIKKADGMLGFDNAVRFAKKSRALGLGVVGWHTLLQERMIPFESFDAMQLNNEIFKLMHDRSIQASRDLAVEYGEVEWTKGFGIRNTHLMALAPTSTNALISGGVSQGIEPLVANYYAQKTAKGTFIRKNKQLEALLETKGKNTFEVWQQINEDDGSVKNLPFLSADQKAVFATAREINQFAIVRQAAQRQQWIDQGQSVNLFFAGASNLDDGDRKKLGQYIHEVHMEAYDSGLKGLYYLRPTSVLKGDQVYRDSSECLSCEA